MKKPNIEFINLFNIDFLREKFILFIVLFFRDYQIYHMIEIGRDIS